MTLSKIFFGTGFFNLILFAVSNNVFIATSLTRYLSFTVHKSPALFKVILLLLLSAINILSIDDTFSI